MYLLGKNALSKQASYFKIKVPCSNIDGKLYLKFEVNYLEFDVICLEFKESENLKQKDRFLAKML